MVLSVFRSTALWRAGLASVAFVLFDAPTRAETSVQTLPQINVEAPASDPGVTPDAAPPAPAAQSDGASAMSAPANAAASARVITGTELNALPASRTGEVLEAVPGLIVTQHSGEGKANQYFPARLQSRSWH